MPLENHKKHHIFRKDNVDRHLLSTAIILLFIEITVLFADLEFITLPYFQNEKFKNQKIGRILNTREEVRRRGQESLVWENSEANDQLFAYDSILTLKNSAAKITLNNDVNIQIYENTLIFLEPSGKKQDDGIRLQFNRGNLRSKTERELLVGTKTWTMEAKPGSDLSLRSVMNEKLEVEVKTGEVVFVNKETQEKKSIEQGHRIKLGKREFEDVKQLSPNLEWAYDRSQKVYSHKFPALVPLKWTGVAKKIHYFRPLHFQGSEAVENLNETQLNLNPGTYYLHLENGPEVSSSLTLHVLPAPKIRHFSPLPRDRVEITNETQFSWLKSSVAKSYILEISTDESFIRSEIHPSPNSHTFYKFQQLGSFHWRVIQIDEEGFRIPASFSYPIYSVQDPFAPPRINLPIQREPSEEKKIKTKQKKRDHTSRIDIFKFIFNQMMPQLNAQESKQKIKKVRKVEFSWEVVPSADYYVVEISPTPDFENPVVNQKVYANRFIWTESYRQDIYYFRVAAGDENGRMGIFTAPYPADLRLIEVSPSQTTIVQPQINLKPKKTSPTPPSPPPKEEKKVEVEKQKNEPLQPPPPIDESIAYFSKQPTWIYRVWLSGSYHLEDQKVKGDFKSSLTGWTPFQLGTHFQTRRHSIFAIAAFKEWKADPVELPFQSNLTAWEAELSYLYHESKIWSWGGGVKSTTSFEREDFEKIKIKTIIFPTLNAQWSHLDEKWQFKTDFQLGYMDSTALAFTRASYQYKVNMDSWNFFVGTKLELTGLFGSQREGYRIEPALVIGGEW